MARYFLNNFQKSRNSLVFKINTVHILTNTLRFPEPVFLTAYGRAALTPKMTHYDVMSFEISLMTSPRCELWRHRLGPIRRSWKACWGPSKWHAFVIIFEDCAHFDAQNWVQTVGCNKNVIYKNLLPLYFGGFAKIGCVAIKSQA